MKKILIIDDETDLCLLLKGFLVQKKYEVLMANDLKNGINQANIFLPDILILDNNLPDGQGWDSINWFLAQFPELHIYLISAFKTHIESSYKKARVTILEKPLSLYQIEQSLGLHN